MHIIFIYKHLFYKYIVRRSVSLATKGKNIKIGFWHLKSLKLNKKKRKFEIKYFWAQQMLSSLFSSKMACCTISEKSLKLISEQKKISYLCISPRNYKLKLKM